MADTTHRYEPRNWRRLCDVCGMLRNISDMHKQDELWVCTYDAGERVRTELDRGNAQQRPFTIKPVPYPKPQNNYYPTLLETDDAAVFNFLSQQVSAQCRYEYVQSGHAAATSLRQSLPALSWAARSFYDLIQENDQSRRLLIPKAKELLDTIATFLQTRQRGFGSTSSSTRATDPYYGGFLASGATVYVTQDASTCGLALLYAYRVLGTLSYRDGARAAASYLRNVQAIGSNATQHTSTSANGSGRLYTGAVCSEVSTVFGGDPSERFYSHHLFYPGDLVALEFWHELKTTDGDQSIGLTAVVDGFDTIPSQLLSQSITDMRDCWSTGITDSTGTLINGLSSSTPREYFNAYPATKTGFNIAGTGRWEYADGNASVGTQITSQNFAKAIASLYAYEGATSQVTGLSDWLRGFTSNADFETPANTSTSVLYNGTTGTYDPTLSIATLLQVRDPDTLAATTINGSSLYDWGAFGLMSRLWASRNKGSFMSSRLFPLNTVQRYFNGNDTDGLTSDRITLRGLSGLTLQTAFSSDTNSNGPSAFPASGTTGVSTPPSTGLVFWVKGDVGLESSAGLVTAWRDQGPFHQDLLSDGNAPFAGNVPIGNIPSVFFPLGAVSKYLVHSGTMKDRNGVAFTASHPRTVLAIIHPQQGNVGYLRTGGAVFSFREQPYFQCLFSLEGFFHPNGFYLFDNAWPFSGGQLLGPDTPQA